MRSLKETNEELGFGIPFEKNAEVALTSFIESEGLSLGKAHYMGAKTKKVPGWLLQKS